MALPTPDLTRAARARAVALLAVVLAAMVGLTVLPAAGAATFAPGAVSAEDPPTPEPTPEPPPEPTEPPAPAGPLRIMVAGDSISHEFAGDYTWRWRLSQELQRQGVKAQFVGPRTGTYGPIPFQLAPWKGDRHAAQGGTLLATQRSRIRGDVATYKPDVVLVMIGFNDLNHGASPAAVTANMEQYLSRIWDANPQARVVLSRILESLNWPSGTPRQLPVKATNTGYAALVSKFRTEGRQITLTSEAARWTARTQTSDGVHPSPTGETVLAQRYATTLHSLGILPKAPGLVRGVAWVTPAKAVVTRRGHKVRFSWAYYERRLTMTNAVLRIDSPRLRRPVILRSGMFSTSKTRTLPRGRYTVRLAPVRKWMMGRYGPAVRFVVR